MRSAGTREQLDHVEREEAGDVVEHARVLGQARRQDPLVADRPVRQDQHGTRMAQGELGEPVGQWRQASAGMNQDRHPCLFGEREDVAHLLTVEHEALRARVQLDPAGSRRQTALCLIQRVFRRIEPAERHQPPIAFAGPGQHAVVGHAIGRVAFGVVQREHAGPPRLCGVELGEQLLQGQRAPVLVQPQVGMGVDQFRAGRPQPLGLGEKGRKRVGV